VSVVAAGAPVPEFRLTTEEGEDFTAADLRGQTTVLVFYPYAFSAVCTDQFNLYEEVLEELTAQGARVYGVSCDAPESQRAFRQSLGVSIPQLSDFEPKGAACRAFGVYHPAGMAQRALVIVDRQGIVQWSYQAATPGDLPGANLIFDGLAA
jgi:peroxiredoxin (alkyl hydroperoxide reductase subunit C)